MKLEYKTASGQTDYETLADYTDVVREWQPNATAKSQHDDLAVNPGEQNNNFRQPLGNISTKIALDLTVTKADETTAAAFARTTTRTLLGSKNHFKLTVGTEFQYYPNGICTKCSFRLAGATVELNIDLETDLVTKTAP